MSRDQRAFPIQQINIRRRNDNLCLDCGCRNWVDEGGQCQWRFADETFHYKCRWNLQVHVWQYSWRLFSLTYIVTLPPPDTIIHGETPPSQGCSHGGGVSPQAMGCLPMLRHLKTPYPCFRGMIPAWRVHLNLTPGQQPMVQWCSFWAPSPHRLREGPHSCSKYIKPIFSSFPSFLPP